MTLLNTISPFLSVCKIWRWPNDAFEWTRTLSLKFTGQCQLFSGSILDLCCGMQNDCSHLSATLDVSLLLLLFSCNVFWGFPTFSSSPSLEFRVASFFWQKDKSHFWVTLSGRRDDHLTETTLFCHFVSFTSTHFQLEGWWCLLESKIISSAFVSVEKVVHFHWCKPVIWFLPFFSFLSFNTYNQSTILRKNRFHLSPLSNPGKG